uniref:Uncharacterized protein n=1 Tax=Myoviridae sp. cti9m5 TaxID=2827613 RepID=A0A8S5LP95_9CAUD|nr:MAG TPA: hypothetical protein [Myoviridae sp. cti9m5]
MSRRAERRQRKNRGWEIGSLEFRLPLLWRL